MGKSSGKDRNCRFKNLKKLILPLQNYIQIISMKKNSTLFATVILFLSANIFSQQNWQTYPYAPTSSVLNFSQDDGYHPAPNTSTEWWYINMNLVGSAPNYKKYSVMLCYFRFANMRIFNIASESDNTYVNDVIQQPFFPTAFTSQLNHWELTYTKTFPNPVNDFSKWTFPDDGKTYNYVYHAEDPVHNDGLDVTVISNRAPLVVGGNGYIALGDKGDSSYYYSYTNMKVTGSLKYKGTTDNITSGVAWIDRQYGPFTVGTNPDNLYEWFSLQLDNPGAVLGQPQSASEFNIWQIYSDSTSVPYQPEWRLVSGIYPDNSQDTSSSYIFERTGYWYDQSQQKYYSQGWRFINPAKDVTVDLVPPVKDQLVDVIAFRFWEGGVNLKGVIQNKNVDGVGFAEIVAGHNFPITVPSVPVGLTAVSASDHYSLSWTASAAGTYPIGGYRIFRSKTNDGHWKYIASTINLFYDDYSASMDSVYYYTVTSFDNQTSTSASEYATAVLAAPLNSSEISPHSTVGRSPEFKIYPNPTNKNFVIELEKPKNAKLEICNSIGQSVKSAIIYSEKTTVEINDLPEGIYILKVSANEANSYRKFVKIK